MLVKATKTMAKELQKILPNGYELKCVNLTESQFRWYVDIDSYLHEQDYNINTGKFNVLQLCYPNEFFANVRYITTKELSAIFRKSSKTWDSFTKEFLATVEI